MKRIWLLIFAVLVIFSCKKKTDDAKWEGVFGQGNAFSVKTSGETDIIACGILDNKPYLIRLSNNMAKETDYKYEADGLFSSLWNDTAIYIAGGSSERKMLLVRIDRKGFEVWDTIVNAGFDVDLTDIIYTGEGTFLATGSASIDISGSGGSGLIFIRFDTTGNVIEHKEITGSGFITAEKTCIDNHGNIYLALTRQNEGANTRATVAKFNSDLQKLWETELYNNPAFAAATYGISVDGAGNVYVTGKTEVSRESGKLDNSFLTSLNSAGSVRWKKYTENANTGTDVEVNDNVILMLNRNCFIVNMANPDDGTDAGVVRLFDVCDSYDTDAVGSDLDLNGNGDLLFAGKKGDNFYLALKRTGL